MNECLRKALEHGVWLVVQRLCTQITVNIARLSTFECDANSRIFHIGAVEQKAILSHGHALQCQYCVFEDPCFTTPFHVEYSAKQVCRGLVCLCEKLCFCSCLQPILDTIARL